MAEPLYDIYDQSHRDRLWKHDYEMGRKWFRENYQRPGIPRIRGAIEDFGDLIAKITLENLEKGNRSGHPFYSDPDEYRRLVKTAFAAGYIDEMNELGFMVFE